MDPLQPLWPDAPRHVPDVAFPPTRFVPGHLPHPRRDPSGSLYGAAEPPPGLPADQWRDDESFLAGVDLYHAGYLWEAHEYWEACLVPAKNPTHRALLQALIQLAAALLNAHLGKDRGVATLAAAVTERLEQVVAAVPAGGRVSGIDPARLLADARSALGPGRGPPPRLELS